MEITVNNIKNKPTQRLEKGIYYAIMRSDGRERLLIVDDFDQVIVFNIKSYSKCHSGDQSNEADRQKIQELYQIKGRITKAKIDLEF